MIPQSLDGPSPGSRPTQAPWPRGWCNWHAGSTANSSPPANENPSGAQPKGYVDDKTARAHVATARVLAQADK